MRAASPFLMRAATAGQRKLPGGLATLLLAAALAGCGEQGTAGASSPTTSMTAISTPSASARLAVPTLGGVAASGIVLPTYFVTIVESRYGLLTVVTTPGSSCIAEAAMPDGTQVTGPELHTPRIADPQGRVRFSYPATPGTAGRGMHTVACRHDGQSGEARARFEVK